MRTSLYVFIILALALANVSAQSAEKKVNAGTSFNYKYDDNIRVSPTNQITLSGLTLDGYVDAAYATPRFEATAYLKLGIERYDSVDLDSDDLNIAELQTSDFDNDSQDFNTEISYNWERHTLSLYGRYWRDSTLNTQFQDTGLGGGLREIEGATRRTTSIVRPAWQWQLTDRQQLDTSLESQTVAYENERYIGYDYNSIATNWSYVLNERLRLQARPYFSRFENDAERAVESDTLGLQVGAVWSITEKWQLNALVGGASVSTAFSGPGVPVLNPDGGVDFVEVEDQDSTSFIGDVTLGFDEQYYGYSANVSSSISPSGDGILRQRTQARLKYYWKPRARMQLDLDARVARSDTTGDLIDDERDTAELAVRLGYQFAENWWFSARYGYRTQDYERNSFGKGSGNSITASVSYRLPDEIL